MTHKHLPQTEYIFDAAYVERETMEAARSETFHTALLAAVRNGVGVARNVMTSPDASRMYDAAGAYLVRAAALEETTMQPNVSVPVPHVIEDALWHFTNRYKAAVKGRRLPQTLNPQCRFDTYSVSPSPQTYQKEILPDPDGFMLYHIISGVRTLEARSRESRARVFEAELSWRDTVIVAPGDRSNTNQMWSIHYVPEKSPPQAISIAQGIVQ